MAAALVLALASAHDAGASARRFEQDPTGAERYEYVSPSPGSRLVSRWNNVALRPGAAIDGGTLAAARITVRGSTSGALDGAISLAPDGKTIVFAPATPFAAGEQVEVSLAEGIRTRAGEELPPIAFTFTVAAADPSEPWPAGLAEMLADEGSAAGESPQDLSAAGGDESAAGPGGNPVALACGPLPASYPPISLLFSDQPEPGHVFLSPFRTVLPGHLVIVDNLGQPLFYRRIPRPSTDFKRQPDGRLTYFHRGVPASQSKFYALDASYAVVDSFAAGNGYVTDSHELLLLPDGHFLLMIYDPQPVRMDLIVPNGKANAVVTGLVIQELDAARNVVFQWRSWDHFEITDVDPMVSLTGFFIDYVHGNSIAVDHDGQLLVSSRHLNEVTKINRQTGDVIWRMGQNARKNEFAFFGGDTRGFSFQHDVRRLPNGHITLFDNGNNILPEVSRALEYELDETSKVATLVWQYRKTPGVFGAFMGNVQRHANGATMIGWGGTNPNPKVTELHPDGTRAFELGMANGTWSYRALRFPWRTTRFTAEPAALDFGDVRLDAPASRTIAVRNPGAAALTIHCGFVTDPAFEIVTPLPVTLDPGAALDVEVRFSPVEERSHAGKLYLRSQGETELIAQDVELAGTGVTNRPPDCTLARATPDVLWPPDHALVPATIEGVVDPDGDPVTLEITSILQDEEVPGGEEPSCPDAIVEGAVALLRAERDGAGDGRVYVIGFAATDPAGLRCEGSVRVCVPHDQGVGPDGEPGPPGTCGDETPEVSALEPCAAPDAERLRRGGHEAGAGLALRAGLAPGVTGSDPDACSIEFTLPAESEVTLAIYDLAGRRVQVLEGGLRAAGAHQVAWRTAGVGSGMYFCRIRARNAAVTVPILVVR